MPREPKKTPRPLQSPFLSTLLLDPGGVHTYDTESFGSYVLAGPGEVDLVQSHYASLNHFAFGTTESLERAVVRMYLAVAKHSRRFRVVTKGDFRPFTDRYARVESRSFFGGVKIRELYPEALPVTGIPDNIAIVVTEFPENLGRLTTQATHQGGGNAYGALLFDAANLAAFELVPTPTRLLGPQRLDAFASFESA